MDKNNRFMNQCPKCMSEDVVVRPTKNKKFRCVCRDCGEASGEFENMEDAIAVWNCRTKKQL